MDQIDGRQAAVQLLNATPAGLRCGSADLAKLGIVPRGQCHAPISGPTSAESAWSREAALGLEPCLSGLSSYLAPADHQLLVSVAAGRCTALQAVSACSCLHKECRKGHLPTFSSGHESVVALSRAEQKQSLAAPGLVPPMSRSSQEAVAAKSSTAGSSASDNVKEGDAAPAPAAKKACSRVAYSLLVSVCCTAVP